MIKQKDFYSLRSEKYVGGAFYSEYLDSFFENTDEFYPKLIEYSISENNRFLNLNLDHEILSEYSIEKIKEFRKCRMIKWPELTDAYFEYDDSDEYIQELPNHAHKLIKELNDFLDKSPTNIYEPLDVRLENVIDVEYLKAEINKRINS